MPLPRACTVVGEMPVAPAAASWPQRRHAIRPSGQCRRCAPWRSGSGSTSGACALRGRRAASAGPMSRLRLASVLRRQPSRCAGCAGPWRRTWRGRMPRSCRPPSRCRHRRLGQGRRCHHPFGAGDRRRLPRRARPERTLSRAGARPAATGQVHLGIAMDTPDGLLVPVQHVGGRGAASLRRGLTAMKADASARRIPREELRGQTITLSNFGMFGGRYAQLTVLPPQVAILGAGHIASRVVARGADPCPSAACSPLAHFRPSRRHGRRGCPVPRRRATADLERATSTRA